jgi:hypothetical protein
MPDADACDIAEGQALGRGETMSPHLERFVLIALDSLLSAAEVA